MASIHDAKLKYAPELEIQEALELEEVIEFLADETEVDPETIEQVLDGLHELAFWYLVRARPIPLPGVGQLIPTLDLDGTFGASLEVSPELQQRMSEPGEYRGGINRAENIGVHPRRLAQMWDAANPDDPIADHDPFGWDGD